MWSVWLESADGKNCSCLGMGRSSQAENGRDPTLSTRRNPMQPVFSTSTHIVLATVQGGRRLFCLFLGFEGISIAAPESFPSGPWAHRR